MTPQIALRWQLLALIVLIGVVLYLLGPVLTPFAVAAMFANGKSFAAASRGAGAAS